jgi:hydroxymethylglutaryl-CoA lyase
VPVSSDERGTPPATRRLLDVVGKRVPTEKLGCHFHDTYGQAIANLDAALSFGIRRIDSAAGGVGRCIFAKGATGNVATEDVLTLLDAYGLAPGVDALKLARVGQALCDDVGEANSSNTGRALLRLHGADT